MGLKIYISNKQLWYNKYKVTVIGLNNSGKSFLFYNCGTVLNPTQVG